MPAGDDSAVMAEIEEVDPVTGRTLQRTHATLGDKEVYPDNTVTFLPENSDWPKGTWNLTTDRATLVATFEELREFLGEADLRSRLRSMMELPVWRAAPEAVRVGAAGFLAAGGGADPRVAGTETLLALVEAASGREAADELAGRLDPAGRHVVGWAVQHEDVEGRVTTRGLWLVKVLGTTVPERIVINVDPARFELLAPYEETAE